MSNDNNSDSKIEILLQSNNCLNERIISDCKISYDVGLVIASSIILIMIYSVIYGNYKAFTAIPILIFSGHMIILHIAHIIMKFEWHMIEHIEKKLDVLCEENILSFTRKLGIFRDLNNFENKIKSREVWFRWKKLYILFLIYILTIIITFWLNWGVKIGDTNYMIFEIYCWFYFILLVLYIIAIFKIRKEYNNYVNKIKSLSDNSNSANQR